MDKIGLQFRCQDDIVHRTILRYLTTPEFGYNYYIQVSNFTVDIAIYALMMVNMDDRNM